MLSAGSHSNSIAQGKQGALPTTNGIAEATNGNAHATAAQQKISAQVALFAILAIWVMQVMGFTMPKATQAKSWEVLDLIKTGILGFGCLGGAYMAWRALQLPKFWRAISPLIPFGVYFAYALVSVLWSPLKSVTIAQCGGLAALLLLAMATSAVCHDRACLSRILRHLNWALIASSFVVLVAYLIDPTASGLNRDRIHSGGDGMIHPTAAGATASLGLLLPVLCHFIGKLRWAKRTFLPCLIIHGCILFLSNSRTATLMAGITIGTVLFWHSTNWQRAKVISVTGLMLLALLVMDPGFRSVEKTLGASTQYVARGQSSDQIAGMSGRSEMWEAIWKEYQKALVLGHGYFVTSETGEIEVWNHKNNYTAHNLVLQVLATTGALGLAIFSLALFQPGVTVYDLRLGDAVQRRVFFMIVVSAVWFLGWAQLSISFMGPVRPESIYFFTLLGVGLGQASQLARGRQSGNARR